MTDNRYESIFSVQADIENIDEIDAAIDNGANEIGVLRTESLYRNHQSAELQQYQYYCQIFAKCGKRQITVRTYEGGLNISPLGLWGVRYSMANPEIFQTQLRAIIRAGKGYNIRIAIPGVADLAQFKWAKQQLQLVREQLDEQEISYNSNTPLGIMVEIPALIICIDMLKHEVNFYIVDSDKLLRYLMALDTNWPMLEPLNDPMHPALIRAIRQIIDAKREYRLDVTVCGIVAEYRQVIPILKGIGIRGLVVKPKLVSQTIKVLNILNYENSIRIASKSLALSSSDRIKNYVDSALNKLGL